MGSVVPLLGWQTSFYYYLLNLFSFLLTTCATPSLVSDVLHTRQVCAHEFTILIFTLLFLPNVMRIEKVIENKKRYIDLLLLADEQEDMIDRYLERGDMFVMQDEHDKAIAVAVVTVEDDDTVELKNLAVAETEQGKGYGKLMIEYICESYSDKFSVLLVGTGDVDATVGFYKHCGFSYSHRIKDFFTEHYDHPIYEDGVQLIDMVCLKRDIDIV